jgi:hypothetical protein
VWRVRSCQACELTMALLAQSPYCDFRPVRQCQPHSTGFMGLQVPKSPSSSLPSLTLGRYMRTVADDDTRLESRAPVPGQSGRRPVTNERRWP